ncbi:GNAT family N-acetyltransferase [Oceanidesulfovibrio indonesiensis]|uniref:GNAT family N-acetyltransferase n=2 Tax=Oceanidesulfovibrio indonesiensis TaxID=54767 RepID=A0A7M3MA09_9BACT|nr:GNAT family N-acetyltransferase [Oceanidesulfovibrio indonesiensis]
MVKISKLDKLFKPTSVAVIGASEEPGSPGRQIMENLLSGTFLGPVMPVREDMQPVLGQESSRSVDTLPLTPDMACIIAPHEELPRHLEDLGKRGCHAAVVLSRGRFRFDRDARDGYTRNLLDITQKYEMRILGPNCLGFINPSIGLNASLAHRHALPGKVAFVSQSDSLFATVLDWATSQSIGFSHFISLGDRYDIRFGNVLDYLMSDPNTRAVLLYIETIMNARSFLSAARAVARNKPVLVLKAGRSIQGARAAAAHSGAFLGSDEVYDAAFRRAGMLRVNDIDTLFDTVETLARTRPLRGERLAILTNGGSPGFLATDSLVAGGGKLAMLEDKTEEQLIEAMEGAWSFDNPLILRSDASGELYSQALSYLLKDKNTDAVLVMHVPTHAVSDSEVAEAVTKTARTSKRNVLTSFLGEEAAEDARAVFAKAGIPTYATPDKAIRGFQNMVQYRRNQELLMEAPPSMPESFMPDTDDVKQFVARALESGRQLLGGTEAMGVLSAYKIPAVETRLVSDMEGVEGAVEAANEIGYPVALKVLSPDLLRKSLAGGVALDLESDAAVREAAQHILERVREQQPSARINGFVVQRMMRRAFAHELFIEVVTDPVFGPVIRFGQGGSLTEVADDHAVSLPPLNLGLARELISRTRVASILRGHREFPAANMDAICQTLVKVSQLIVDVPEIFELSVNPLFADSEGVMALDCAIHVAKAEVARGEDQLAIRPYPRELEVCVTLKDGRRVFLRPIRPEDEPAHWEFLEHVSAEDMRYRFFSNIGELPRTEMAKLTHIDYDREMAFIAKGSEVCGDESGEEKTLGVVRASTSPDNEVAEFAILIRSDLKRLGLGKQLMQKIIEYCRSRGTHKIVGQALAENAGMVGLAEAVGFEVTKDFEDDVYNFEQILNPHEK